LGVQSLHCPASHFAHQFRLLRVAGNPGQGGEGSPVSDFSQGVGREFAGFGLFALKQHYERLDCFLSYAGEGVRRVFQDEAV